MARPVILLQQLHLGPNGLQVASQVLALLEPSFGTELRLDPDQGELLLMPTAELRELPAGLLAALADGRPVIGVDDPGPDAFSAGLSRQALRQALEVALLQRLGSHDSEPHTPSMVASDWSPLVRGRERAEPPSPAQQAAFAALCEQVDQPTGVLRLALPDCGAFQLDFVRGQARVDVAARRRLSEQMVLPVIGQALPGRESRGVALDLLLWELGLAAHRITPPLAPAHWWTHPLESLQVQQVPRYSLDPQMLKMARRLAAWPQSPAELRHATRTSLERVCGFVQAALLLRLVHWT